MSSEGDRREESLDDIRQALGAIIAEQTARQTEITQQQNTAIAALEESVLKLTKEGDQGPSGFFKAKSSHERRPLMKLDFPQFSDDDPEGWIYQVEEYFTYHGIGDGSKLQIAGFHMSGKALSWMRGLRRNKLLSTWMNFVDSMRG